MNAPHEHVETLVSPRTHSARALLGLVPMFLATLGLGSVISLSAFFWLRDDALNDARAQFERNASDAHHSIEARITSYTDIVYGLRALLYSTPRTSRKQFHNYVQGLDLRKRYPGFLNLNYAEQVPGPQRAVFEARVRRDTDLEPGGYPDFAIQPPGERPYFHVLSYLEPMKGNEATFGRDIVAQPGRKEIFEKQVFASNELTSSGRPVLVDGPHPFWGIAMRLPVYNPGVQLDTVEERRTALQGTLGAGFRVDELMKDVLSEQTLHALNFRVYEAGTVGSPPKSEDRVLLFDSRVPDAPPGAKPQPDGDDFGFNSPLRLTVANRVWDIEYGARHSSFLRAGAVAQPWVVLFGGLLISVLLFGTAYALASSRSRAVSIAAVITQDLRKSEAALRSYAGRLKAVSRRLFEVQESERRLLATELHDRVGQNLSALGMNLSIIASQTDDEDEALANRIEDSTTLIEQTADAMRDVMGELRPQAIDEYGLVAPLRSLATGYSARTGIEATVTGQMPQGSVSRNVELAMFRIVQEALNNIAKHAKARRVEILLSSKGTGAQLRIHDDGVGFDATRLEAVRPDGHWGLLIMRERAEASGASFAIESAPGRGTTIVVDYQPGMSVK